MKNEKKILMICYYYPPIADVGAKRSVAFSKYLLKYGWIPHVVSVRNPDRLYCRIGNDEPPSGVDVTYSRSIINPLKILGKMNGVLFRFFKLLHINLKRNYFIDFLCIPDHFLGWIPLTIVVGYKLIRYQCINVIYVSCTPYSAAFIGVILKLLTGKPLIIDFRDPLTFDIVSRTTVPKLRKKIDVLYEKMVLKKCDLFVVTTEETNTIYDNKYTFLKGKIHTIHNGFDDNCLGRVDVSSKYQKFSICYGGHLYADQGRLYSFFEALSMLSQNNSIDCDTFQFIYSGGSYLLIDKEAQKFGIEDLVVSQDNIPYIDNLNLIRRCHLQLLRIAKPMIPTKLYEGIALNTPFLATIPDGEVAQIIKEYSPSSYIITIDSPHEIAEAILDAKKKYEKHAIKDNRVKDFLEMFSRKNLTRKLIRVLEENLNYCES